jgi:hypothetical protein
MMKPPTRIKPCKGGTFNCCLYWMENGVAECVMERVRQLWDKPDLPYYCADPAANRYVRQVNTESRYAGPV